MSALTIRALDSGDLDDVTAIHLDAFANSSLTSLGGGAVRRYYQWLLEGPHEQLALGAFQSERLQGFCFGGLFRGALSGFLRRNRAYLARRMLLRPWLIVNPLVRERAVAAGKMLLRSRKPPPPAQQTSERVGFGILAIAVSTRARGSGAARALMAAAEEYARDGGFSRMQLSVAPENKRAIAFYEREGWHKVPPGQAWRGVMHKPLR